MTQTRTTSWLPLACTLMALPLIGCADDEEVTTTPPPPAGEIGPGQAVLGSLPPEVRSAFQADYPAAQISGVDAQTSTVGSVVYEVTYLDNGQPGVARYTGSGETVR